MPRNPKPGSGSSATAAAKLALRDRLLTRRHRRSLAEGAAAAAAIARQLLAADEVRRAATVAAYVSMPGEPGTGLLLDALREAGTRVILPVLRPDDDLDWASYEGPTRLQSARFGLLEPDGPRLGRVAVATADVVLLPGLAVSSTGLRLGRGGGSYDRVLARVPVGTFTCVLLFDEELDQAVPVEAHDLPVAAAATPQGLTRWAPGPA